MMCRATRASSRAVIWWPGSCSPVAFLKVDFLRPIGRASSIMRLANSDSLPAMFSATEMAASLPDWTMMPLSSSSSLAFLPTGTIIAEVPEGAPPLRQAYSLMKNSSSSLIWPAFSALKVTASSMSLLMLAG